MDDYKVVVREWITDQNIPGPSGARFGHIEEISSKERMNYEGRIDDIRVSIKEMQDFLNRMLSEGWELVSHTLEVSHNGQAVYIFKRKVNLG